MFDGQSGLVYEIWSRRTKTFLQEHGYDIWYSVVTGYNALEKTNTATKKELKKIHNNKITMAFIMEGLK
jgi:hypothetical protein